MNTTLENKTIYLDYASSTPVDVSVLDYMHTIQSTVFGNAHAIHAQGRHASLILEESRRQVAAAIHAHANEIVFTSGGTESDNLAILGTLAAFKKQHPDSIPHIIISSIEHPAVYELVTKLYTNNEIELDMAPVDSSGIIDTVEFKHMLKSNTVLVSIMHANNEIGTIQPIAEIAKSIRHYKKHRSEVSETLQPYPLLHTDACQSFVYLDIAVESLGIDLLSINSSKIYGPKGVGALFVKRKTPIESIFVGGDQENLLRPGTENVPLIAAFAKAIEKNEAQKINESTRIQTLRDMLFADIKILFPDVIYNGDTKDKLPNNLNITIPHIKSEQFVIYADSFNIAISEKSACKTDAVGLSHVISALRTAQQIQQNDEEGSIRFSLGRFTTKEDITEVIARLTEIKKLLLNT